MKKLIRNVLLGSKRIPSRIAYKFALLRGQFALLLLFITVFYICVDWSNDVFSFMPWYLLMIAIGVSAIILNRKGYYILTNLFLVVTVNAIIYLFADVDHPQGGVYFFFANTSVMGLILFSTYGKPLQIFFGLLPIGLGYLALLEDFNLMIPPLNDPAMMRVNFLANFSTGLLTTILIVQFLISRNKESERSLIESQQAISKTSENLMKSEERYSMALKGTRAGIYEWNVKENRVEVSDYWKTLLGYGPSEMTRVTLETFLEMVHPDDIARISEAVQRHMSAQTPYQNEVRMRRKDGSFKWFQDTGIGKMDDAGNPQVVIGSIIEIHERKMAEEKILSQNDLLAKANKELDHFVYSVSHDLRAPLSSILGLTNIYAMARDQGERDDIIRMVSDRAHVLDNFIREVLDYSRNARLDLNLQPVLIADLVQEVLSGLAHMEGIQALDIRTEIENDLEILTDHDRIKVILSNLLANAVNYRDHGKKSYVLVRAAVNNEFWSVEVEDNGIGIKPEHHTRIFEMFYKAHDNSKGTGLGLYIVNESLQRLKGNIEVVSEYGRGSTFKFRVPV